PNFLTLQFAVAGSGRLQSHPYPGNAEFDQFQHGVFANRIGGSKDGKLPALACLLHELEQAHGARTVKQEVFVHHKKGMYFEFGFDAAHHLKQFVAGLVKVDKLSFAAKKRRRGTEVAPHGAAHRRDDGCRRTALPLRQAYSHDACLQTRNNQGMADRSVLVFSQVPPHPRDPFSAYDMVSVDHRLRVGNRSHVSTHHNYRIRRQFPYHAAHLPHLANIHDDRRDPDDVVVVLGQFTGKGLAVGKIEHTARRRNIFLNHHNAPGAMEHAQREAALGARDLVVIELHRIDGAAAKFVVLRIRPEDRTQQYASVTTLGVSFHLFGIHRLLPQG